MSLSLRLILIIAPILGQVYIISRIRKSKMKAEDSFFWVLFSAILVILGLFSDIALFFSELLGIQSPANLVFLVMIALLIFKIFSLSAKLSSMERRFQSLVQQLAVNEKDDREDIETLKQDK